MVTAWKDGINGLGAIIAIIDSGIDIDSPEFAGRLHADSQYVAGIGSVNAVSDHGTNVAMVSSAARDGLGIVGIAFESTILALRSDAPGSCNGDAGGLLDGCSFNDDDIAKGVDQAVASGAVVINMSLGGSRANPALAAALERAADAGIVIIVSAGNDGGSTDPNLDPSQPDPFASHIIDLVGGNAIIVGSVDQNSTISDFSNLAGSYGSAYLTARGEAICCSYEDGELFVETDASGGQFVTLFSGTSFSAPQVAGAVALLAQAFPNLTASEIVEILLNTARDAGAAGTDEIYGRGILDIEAAFQPSGTASLAGSKHTLTSLASGGFMSAPMGDAASTASTSAIVTDKYGRAFEYNLASGLSQAPSQRKLYGAVGNGSRRVAAGGGDVSVAFTVAQPQGGVSALPLNLSQRDAEQARVLAARVALQISPDTALAFGISEGAGGLVGQLQGQERPAFLVASSADGATGFAQSSDMSLAARHQLGAWGLTLSMDKAQIYSGAELAQLGRPQNRTARHQAQSLGFALDRQFGALDTTLGVSLFSEEETVLGARFHEAFGASGADSVFTDATLGWRPAPKWRLGAAYRFGLTRPYQNDALGNGSQLQSMAWSFDVSREGVFAPSGVLGLRISQPLRVESGGLNLMLPVSYDYATETPIFGQRSLSLAPEGREIMGELSWNGPLWGGYASTGLFVRLEPGNIATASEDVGAVVKWNTRF